MQHPNKCLRLVAITSLIILGATAKLYAQVKYTAVLPDKDQAIPPSAQNADLHIAANLRQIETARSLFFFDLNNLPRNARVNQLSLKLAVSSKTNTLSGASQTITILQGKQPWSAVNDLNDPSLPSWTDFKKNQASIGLAEVKASTQLLSFDLGLPQDRDSNYVSQFLPPGAGGALYLAARSTSKEDNFFYSSASATTRDSISKKPKLVVQYQVFPSIKRNDWGQAFNSPQRSSLLNWKNNADITSAGFRVLPNGRSDLYVGADLTGPIGIFKNMPVVFTQSASGISIVYAVKQLDGGGNEIWSIGVNDIAKCSPLIDEYGRLYYLTSNSMSILDMNNTGTYASFNGKNFRWLQISDITNKQASSIRDGATIGYDGTLYLSTDSGLLALSAFPQFKTRWKYNTSINERTGLVSLTPDESKAFFISYNTQQNNSRLIVLDNIDGTLLASRTISADYDNDGNLYIPAPVVQSNNKVFVLSGYDNGNKLFVYNLDATNTLNIIDTIDSKATNNTGISQPVIDAKSNVYFVYNKKLARYDTTQLYKVNVFSTPDSLDNATILVTDASSDIFALDPYYGANRVSGFKFNGKQFDTLFSQVVTGDGSLKKNLVLSPDGTLYTVTSNNVIAIGPRSVTLDDLVLSGLNTNTVYRANKSITVNGFDVSPSINAVLFSGESISFKPGFRVKLGAQLSCKTGY